MLPLTNDSPLLDEREKIIAMQTTETKGLKALYCSFLLHPVMSSVYPAALPLFLIFESFFQLTHHS